MKLEGNSRPNTCLAVVSTILLTAVLATVAAAPVGADEASPAPTESEGGGAAHDLEFLNLQSRWAWSAYSDARPLSPYYAVPAEFRAGVPFSHSYIDSTPGRSECFAALYTPEQLAEEAVLDQTGKYQNKTMSRSNNPEVGRGTKAEFAPFGPTGPHTRTENPYRTECRGEAVWGAGEPGSVFVNGGMARTSTVFDRKSAVVNEALSQLQGVDLGGVIKVASLTSHLKMTSEVGSEPRIDYTMTLAGIEAGDQPLIGFGDKGITLAGQQVAASDLIDQFNAQAEQQGKALASSVNGRLRLLAPTVKRDEDSGAVKVTAPALWAGSSFPSRKGQPGESFGIRLGLAEVYAYLIDTASG